MSIDQRRLARGVRPDPGVARRLPPLTARDLADGLDALGLTPGIPTMLHVSLRSLGWIAGGVDALVAWLADLAGRRGTLTAQVGWEDNRWHMYADELPDAWRRAYLEDAPPFDPLTSQAAHYEGRFAERLRTWPGARRSAHPHVGVAAVGADAEWITAEHALDGGFGEHSPYGRLVAARGQVLLLGAPCSTISVLHHAEATARVPDKRYFSYCVPLLVDGDRQWARIDDLDVHSGALPYERSACASQPFEAIAGDALEAGIGSAARIGAAACHLFPADRLVAFAVDWLERELGAANVDRRSSG